MGKTKTPWGPVGYITYKRTYARKFKNKEPETEEFTDTVDRIIKACKTQLKINFTEQEEKELEEIFLSLKGSVAGRFWWQLGTYTVSKLGLLSLQNCAFVTCDSPRAFTWTMDALMLGSGVGFNIQKEFVYQLPKVKKAKIVRQDNNDVDFVVPDNREGWVKLLAEVLKAQFETGEGFTYSTVLIRGKGTPINGFGGIASGPEELCEGIDKINKIFNSRSGKKLRPIDCLDIMNIIGSIVVAGNVRRSAEIAIGDADDLQYLSSKNWSEGNIPNHRAMSNNSVVCNDINLLPNQFWNSYTGNGEPFGLINLNLARTCGRLGETQYPDNDVMGFNPCAEQPLAPYETCCLAETFLPNISSLKELKKVVKYLYIICKHSLLLPCHLKETESIVHKNMRMGIGITGYLQATEEQKSWLNETYEFLRSFDIEYSKNLNCPTSIKLTTIKPSGTLSLLPGVTPGCHAAIYKRYIRRLRISSNSNLANLCRKHGYHSEYQKQFDGTEDKNTVVVSFPVEVPENTILAENLTAIKQLEVVKELQTNWSDNAVSCTVYYKKEELPEIKQWLKENYNNSIKSVSFLLHTGHGFLQAPYEEISKEQYDSYIKLVKPIESGNINEEDMLDSFECIGGICPIK